MFNFYYYNSSSLWKIVIPFWKRKCLHFATFCETIKIKTESKRDGILKRISLEKDCKRELVLTRWIFFFKIVLERFDLIIQGENIISKRFFKMGLARFWRGAKVCKRILFSFLTICSKIFFQLILDDCPISWRKIFEMILLNPKWNFGRKKNIFSNLAILFYT